MALTSVQIMSPPTSIRLGGVKQGTGILISPQGEISVSGGGGSGTITSITAGTGLGAPATGDSITTVGTIDLLPASVSTIGGVKPGTGLSIALDGTISIAPTYAIFSGEGTGNIFSCDTSLSSLSSGVNNFLVGINAGYQITSGSDNIFLGIYSGYNTTSGSDNIFIGSNAGYNNTFGLNNLFIGKNSGYSNVSGDYNTFIGFETGKANTSGQNNTFIGNQAGLCNTIGFGNLFAGRCAGVYNVEGSFNTFLGNRSGCCNTTGTSNVFLGRLAGLNNVSGNNNLFAGNESGACNVAGSCNTFLGYGSGREITGSNNTVIGPFSGTSFSACSNHIFISDGSQNNRLQINDCGALGLNGANYGTFGQLVSSKGATSAPSWISVVPEQVTNEFSTPLTPVSGTLTVNVVTTPIILGALTAPVTQWKFSIDDIFRPNISRTITLIIEASAANTYGSSCSVEYTDGTIVNTTIGWAGNSVPTASNGTDILAFNIITSSGSPSLKVLGVSSLNYPV